MILKMMVRKVSEQNSGRGKEEAGFVIGREGNGLTLLLFYYAEKPFCSPWRPMNESLIGLLFERGC